jgi:5-methylcytosine-specific restriction protein A
MPTASLRPCTYPGCHNLSHEARCPRHPYPVKLDQRQSAARRGYDAAWLNLRTWKLRHSPLCEIRHHCNGTPGTEVDHITPINMDPTRRLDPHNLQTACGPCHKWKTATIDRPALAQAGIRPGQRTR